MTAKRKNRVRKGNSHLTIFPWVHPTSGKKCYRFHWFDSTGKRRTTTKATKAEAEEAAEERLAKAGAGVLAELSPARKRFLEAVNRETAEGDEAAVLAFIESRKVSAKVETLVPRFMAYKLAGKAETPHLKQVRRDLEDFAGKHAGRTLVDLAEDELAAWVDARTGSAGADRRKGVRGTLVMFYRWAHVRGMAGREARSLAERLPQVESTKGKLEHFRLAELEYLLSIVGREWFPLIILGAFQGIRPEELAPKKDNPKPRLRWQDIDWEFNSITVPADVCKTRGKVGRARTFPLHPVTRAWLEAYGVEPTWTGDICKGNPGEAYGKDDKGKSRRLTTLWGMALAAKFPDRFTGWPQDALRHSYASYRIASVRSTAQVALEMGNSEDMLHGYYNNPRPLHEGAAWFAFMPENAGALPCYLKAS